MYSQESQAQPPHLNKSIMFSALYRNFRRPLNFSQKVEIGLDFFVQICYNRYSNRQRNAGAKEEMNL